MNARTTRGLAMFLVFDRYKALGGPVERVVKPGQDHHPHGFKDVALVVKFFADALEKKK